MMKWIFRIALACAALLAVAAVAVYVGGPWTVERYLGREMALGEGRLRIKAPEFRWNLDVTADSLAYASPGLDAQADGIRLSVDLWRSLLRFGPSLDLALDAADLRFKSVDDSLEEKVEKPHEKGPPAFPDFELPAAVKVRVGRLSASGDTAFLGGLTDVTLRGLGKRGASLQVREADLPALKGLKSSLAVEVRWGGAEEVRAKAALALLGSAGAGEGDGADLEVTARKDDLRLGRLELRTRVASVARYAFLLGPSPYVARSGGFDGTLKASLDVRAGLRAGISLDGRYGGLGAPAKTRAARDTAALPIALGPQQLALRLDFKDSSGTWSLRSDGDRGERVDLRGGLAAASAAADSLEDPSWIMRHLAVTLAGRVSGIPVTAAGKTLEARLTVEEARLAPDRLKVRAMTGDSSRVEADLRLGRKGWNGRFAATVAPGEAWFLAFADTNVAFRRFSARGGIKDGEVRAVTDAVHLSAFGVQVDTLAAVHRYDGKAYALESARIIRAGTAWEAKGKVDLARKTRPMEFSLDGGPAGSVSARLPSPDVMEASLRGLRPHRIPYRGLDTLAAYDLTVSGDFRWDRKARDGEASVRATGRYKGEAARLEAEAGWDSRRLEVRRAEAELGATRARAYAAVRLGGRQFHDLKGLGIGDLDSVALEAGRVDLARALKAAMPTPPVTGGSTQGRLSYSPRSGFRGAWRADSVQPAATADLAELRSFRLRGDGDTLRILAVTVSRKEPLLNDSLSVFLAGVLAPVQAVGFEAKVGKTLTAGFRGAMDGFRDIRGTATLAGSVQLPGKSGTLRNLRLRAELAAPFVEALKGLEVRADTLMGEYIVPGVDTQAFAAPLRLAQGRLVIPDLRLRGRNGDEVRGRAEYAIAGSRLEAMLAGGSLVAQAGPDKVRLRDLRVEVRADSASLALDARIGSGSFEHSKPPLRAAGDFSRVVVSYRSPLGKVPEPAGRMARAKAAPKLQPARLKVTAFLDTSHVRYRLRNLDFRGIFKRSAARRTSRPGRPLEVDVSVETAGKGNRIESDVLRFGYVGNFSLKGQLPYALVNGRMTGTGGELGTKRQPYALRNLEVKWLNAPLEEGELEAEATKRLARTCESGEQDSCSLVTRLVGTLGEPMFDYDSDCEGAYGAGADPAALLYSVRRGCYSAMFASGARGMSYEEQVLAMLEPLASQYLTRYAGRLTSNWIEKADVSGLGALASEKQGDSAAVAAKDAIALEILSKEFWRLRMRLKAGYQPQDAQEADPWAYRMGVEWKPPLFRLVDDPKWKRRMRNNVVVEAAVYRDPARAADPNDNGVQRRLGLNYNYDWWGYWWKPEPAGRDKTGAPAEAPGRGSAPPGGGPSPEDGE